jgi:hypothetical protein
LKELLLHFRQRAFAISFNTVRTLMPAIAGFIISVAIVRFFSKELWGSVAAAMLWVYFSSSICSWGSREYILRSFSRFPENIFLTWGSSVVSRHIFLAGVCVMVIFTTQSKRLAALLCICIAARFVYQSFEPVVIYKNRFALISALEFISLSLFISLLFILPHIGLLQVLMIYALTDLFKAIVISIAFNEFLSSYRSFRFQWKFITGALPFFLLGISQLLHARISQFFVNTYLSNSDKAFYQVYINLLLYVAAVPNMVVTPFLKTLFVSGKDVFRKVLGMFLLAALAVVPAALVSIYFLLAWVFHFQVSPKQLLLGGLFALPEFYFALRMYYFFSIDKEKTVVMINAACIALAALLGFLLIPGHGINGALLSAVASQWFTAVLYFVV